MILVIWLALIDVIYSWVAPFFFHKIAFFFLSQWGSFTKIFKDCWLSLFLKLVLICSCFMVRKSSSLARTLSRFSVNLITRQPAVTVLCMSLWYKKVLTVLFYFIISFLIFRMDDTIPKENLGIIVKYKVKVRVIVAYGGWERQSCFFLAEGEWGGEGVWKRVK